MLSRSVLVNCCTSLSLLVAACGGELVDPDGGGAGGGGASGPIGGAGGSPSGGNGGEAGTGGGEGGIGGGISGGNGGEGGIGGEGGNADVTPPIVVLTSPDDLDDDVATNANITVTFNEEMDAATISETSFTLTLGAVTIPGEVDYDGTVATLNPTLNLLVDAEYTATVTTDATDLAGNALVVAETWTFRTGLIEENGPAPVLLGTAENFVILAKSGVANIPTSAITGDLGVSPIDSTGVTGFTLMLDPGGTFATSSQVIGNVYAADYTSPTPANLTVAVLNMEAAYTDAAGRPTPDFLNLGGGELGGLTLVPGLYNWGTGVLISTDVTLDGGPNDVWIFQVAGGITEASGVTVLLSGGAQPENVFWQASGAVALQTGAHLEGVVLSQTEITLATGASANGRLLSQTAVTLDASVVTEPTP